MSHTIVFANQKGGVGKTTSTANIGAALARLGRRVLLIDCDPQANLSEMFGAGDPEAPGLRVEDVLSLEHVASLDAAIWTERAARDGEEGASVPLAGGIHLIPCTDALADVSMDLAATEGAERRLADALATVDDRYDYVLVDTPPGIVPLATIALVAADFVIIPAQPADADVGGAIKMADFIEVDLREMNPDVELLGVLITRADRRWTLSSETIGALASADVERFSIHSPQQVRVASSMRYDAPTVAREPESRVGHAYIRLAGLLDKSLHQTKSKVAA